MDPVRKLNFGIVGGGVGGNIGKSHLRGALMDNQAVLVAGAFSRDQERNRVSGDLWGVSQDRVYPDYGTMAAAESQREDGIDFVIIVTPNHLHYPVAKVFLEHGIHVACEKPFTLTVAEAEELCTIAWEKDLAIAITYTYAHYPMIRQARSLIRDGAIGEVMEIVAEYPEDFQMLAQNQKPDHFSNWFSDPAKAGESSVVGGMGIHAWYLLRAMTGLKEEKVIAQFGYYPKMPVWNRTRGFCCVIRAARRACCGPHRPLSVMTAPSRSRFSAKRARSNGSMMIRPVCAWRWLTSRSRS